MNIYGVHVYTKALSVPALVASQRTLSVICSKYAVLEVFMVYSRCRVMKQNYVL